MTVALLAGCGSSSTDGDATNSAGQPPGGSVEASKKSCPSTIDAGTVAATFTAAYDSPDIFLSNSFVYVVSRIEGSAFGYTVVDIANATSLGTQPLANVVDNSSIYAGAADDEGFVVVTDLMHEDYEGQELQLTYVESDGTLAWQTQANDGGAQEPMEDEPGETTYQHSTDDLAVALADDKVWLDGPAGLQVFDVATGDSVEAPAWFTDDDALANFDFGVVQDGLVVLPAEEQENYDLELPDYNIEKVDPTTGDRTGVDGFTAGYSMNGEKISLDDVQSAQGPTSIDAYDDALVCAPYYYGVADTGQLDVVEFTSGKRLKSIRLPEDVAADDVRLLGTPQRVVVVVPTVDTVDADIEEFQVILIGK